MPLQQTSGAASYDAFGGGAPVAAKYIEDFFQTWLRTGTGSSTTVTTGLNASINKSLVWTKSRSAATNHKLTDTARGVTKALSSNTTGAEVTDSQGLTAFSSTGYTIGTNTDYNNSGATYVDWQWVATPKFFDVVTYTGTGAAQTINHNLGSVPGCIIVKKTSGTGDWFTWHRSLAASLGNDAYIFLNDTSAATTFSGVFGVPTSTTFTVGPDASTSASGATYVAYLFAHNAGGFGLSGTDNVISCGSVTSTSGGTIPTVNLGFEPQWILYKNTTSAWNWEIWDNMRGWSIASTGNATANALRPNTSDAEATQTAFTPTATGFFSNANFGASQTFIYIAIRRGPMRTPTTGTSVFAPVVASNAQGTKNTTNFPIDMQLALNRNGSITNYATDRLRGISTTSTSSGQRLITSSTSQEQASTSTQAWDNTGFQTAADWAFEPLVYENFRRAPGFFDEVCYTGTGSGTIVSHNLAAAPELIITKRRNASSNWGAYHSFTPTQNGYNYLDLDGAGFNATYGTSSRAFQSQPTSTQFITGGQAQIDTSGGTYVAYLFATCPGVSKVGSYTGNGSSQTINCGFTGGARFVMVRRTDNTGNWMVVDTARGLVSAGDPTLYLNSTAAEVTGVDWLDPDSSGFIVNQEGTMNANVNAATYIYLAIA